MLFFVCFLVVLGCHFGAILGPFWDQNRVKIRIFDFLIFIDFPWVVQCFLRFGGSYVRLMLALFSLLFLNRCSDDVWSILGSILESFWGGWGVQIGHFWHRFFDDVCMSFQERPKSAQ